MPTLLRQPLRKLTSMLKAVSMHMYEHKTLLHEPVACKNVDVVIKTCSGKMASTCRFITCSLLWLTDSSHQPVGVYCRLDDVPRAHEK